MWPLQSMWLPAHAALLLALWCVSARGSASGSAQSTTQAGCSCLPNWKAPSGQVQQGCTNPNKDPLGEWCEVDPSSCPGYYGYLPGTAGSSSRNIFYDYCGAVRERTSKGCLCAPSWSPVSGKEVYFNGCARPEPGLRYCQVSFGTCPKGVNVGGFGQDTCRDKQQAAPQQKEGGSKTYRNCSCVPWKWSVGGNSSQATGCANPDDDPLGPWCAVDAASCAAFAGEVVNANKTIAYDYCTGPAPVVHSQPCSTSAGEYQQCGGKSNCTTYGCADAAWPGACCTPGTVCARQDQYHWECLNPAVAAQRAAAAGTPLVTSKAGPASPSPSPVLGGRVAAGTSSKRPGSRIYVQLDISGDGGALVGSAPALSSFKERVAGWLGGAATDPANVYIAGVDDVRPGSILVDGFILFTSTTPNTTIDAAINQLNSAAIKATWAVHEVAALYGPLKAARASAKPFRKAAGAQDLAAATSTTLQGGNASAAGLVQSRSSSGSGSTSGFTPAVMGLIIGVAVGGLLLIALVVVSVSHALRRRAERDVDKDITLAYNNELAEGDLSELEDGDDGRSIDTYEGGSGGSTASTPAAGDGLKGPASLQASPNIYQFGTAGGGDLSSPVFRPALEGGARSSNGGVGGVAYDSLKQRRGGGSSAGAALPSTTSASVPSHPTTPHLPMSRNAGNTASGNFGGSLARMGSSVGQHKGAGGGPPQQPNRQHKYS